MKNLVLVLCTITLLYSTTITGEIVNGDSLEKMDNVLITMEKQDGSLLVQKFFNQKYSIDIQSGNYVLRAYHYSNGSVDYYNQYKLHVTEQQMNFDLILFPYELAQLIPDSNPPPFSNSSSIPQQTAFGSSDIHNYLSVLAGVVLIIGVFLRLPEFINKNKSHNNEPSEPKKNALPEINENEPIELDDDCKKVMKILSENEGRMVQKEIREILNFSETKMSLVVTELEACGIVKRIKKGRENVIKLMKN